jgi:hypothetical protein
MLHNLRISLISLDTIGKLTVQLCSNIKRDCAAINEEIINECFENLKTSVECVPAENVWNFDKINLSDDPGCVKVICKGGSKYNK